MRRLAVHGVALLWIFITAASLLLPANPDLGDHFRWLPVPIDKAAHFMLFLVCTWLVHRSLAFELVRRAAAVAAISTLAYAIATELLQSLVPTRSLDSRDIVANALGIAVYVGWALRGRSTLGRFERDRE